MIGDTCVTTFLIMCVYDVTKKNCHDRVTTLTGFEPATSGFEVQCAIQLRHKVTAGVIMCDHV